jgi:hypothetical protein
MWEDDDMVPHVAYEDVNQKRKPGKSTGWGEKYPTHISIRSKGAELLALGTNKYGAVIYKPFIKIDVSKTKQLYKFVGHLVNENGFAEPVYELSQKKGYSEAGKNIKEYGQRHSIVPSNQSKMLPGGWTDQMETEPVYGTVTYEGEPESAQITYNFTGFQKVKLEDMYIEQLYEGEADDTLDAFEEETPTSELEVMLQDLGARKTTKGNLQIDGQYYYLDYSKMTIMQKGNIEELYLYPTGKDLIGSERNDEVDEIYIGSRQRGQNDFVSDLVTTTPIKEYPVDGLTQQKIDQVKEDKKDCKLS